MKEHFLQSESAGHGYFDQQQHQQQGGVVQGPTVFDTWNQKLLELGIPRWNIGNHVVEPIMTVLVLLTLVFLGFQGLIFLGILYFVVKLSQRSATQPSNRSAGHNRPPSNTMGGHRLGR